MSLSSFSGALCPLLHLLMWEGGGLTMTGLLTFSGGASPATTD